jgi:hypothetical protein
MRFFMYVSYFGIYFYVGVTYDANEGFEYWKTRSIRCSL